MNYESYKFDKKELTLIILNYLGAGILISYLFYDSVVSFLLSVPGVLVYIKLKKAEYIQKQKDLLSIQFSEMISSVSTSLSAGYSPENSFRESLSDMTKMYGRNSLIVKELENIINKISVNRTLELGLKEFAGRCNIEDIDDFVTVFCEGKRNGADFKDMIAKSVYMIRSKKETEKEIDVMLSGKQFEQKVMSIIPLLIVSYMKLTNDEFMGVLYHNPLGIVIMTVCLVIYIMSFIFAKKIVMIRV